MSGSLFLGPIADHLLDRFGALEIADAVAERNGEIYAGRGAREGRDPSLGFDTAAYLAANPDVAAAHFDPLWHYLRLGIHEGRVAIPDGTWG